MRLAPSDRDSIVKLVHELAGPDARVRLFGSRTDDRMRGGDVDLLVSMAGPVERPAWLAARLAARIERALGGRRVDVLLQAPNLAEQAVHRAALAEGVLL